MQQIAIFEKVSLEQFKKDVKKIFYNKYKDEQIKDMWDKIQLPNRATKGSAGYDFKCPFDFINVDKTIPKLIPTGIRVRIDDGWVLKIYPRSSLGFKWGLELVNTVGIIDSDYYYSDNEGHIMAKIIHTDDEYLLQLKQGQGFIQGIFVPYGITTDDNVESIRNGGFGSTDRES